MEEINSTFKLLEKTLPDYETRPQQIKMAGEVYRTFLNKEKIIVEAGTGVGKSFAYLIPAILTKNKTIVSTASIALQDQLVNKDLSFLQKALPLKFSYAILKGKNNYLCLKREKEFSELSTDFMKFRQWTIETKTGDKDELSYVPEFWSKVCGDSDDCNVVKCPYYKDCYYYKHYRSLYKKDILVINHHLLAFDLLSDFNLLPFHEQLVIDEAHQIEDVISHVLGNVLTHSRITWLLYRLRSLKISVDHIFEAVDSFFKRREIPQHAFYPIPEDIIDELINIHSVLSLNNVMERLDSYNEEELNDELSDKIQTTKKYVASLEFTINEFIEQNDRNKVYFVTGNKGKIELKSNLIESDKHFLTLERGFESLVMTSATLATGGSFFFFKQRLGIRDFKEMLIGSPFNYSKQTLLYVDRGLPPPDKENNDIFMKESLKVIENLIKASKGRALVLFTSYKHLDYAAEHISIDYPFKSQGKMPPSHMINWFKKTPNSVLLATATFWQGIDIKGEDLSLVIIVKIPFGSPGDPVYDERCKRLGDRWFSDLALPSAILMLRQGFGRLIRSSSDYGVVAILDSRLLTSSYGKIILSSLPDLKISHDISEVEKFFYQHK
ncbi:MAG: ATP-dependent DNA helicase [Nitrospirae bacterium]|nr:ATP-dependent DNA helicase [Nitrospirota bacterium]